jgi:hypothetical protein
MGTCARAAAVVLFTALGAACSHSPTGPSGPPAVASELLGTWSGIDHTNTTNVGNDEPDLFFVWTASQQNGDAVTGVIMIFTGDTQPPQARENGGTMTVSVAGTTVTVSMSVPPGGLGFMGGIPRCSMTGTGTGAASATQIVVTVTTTFDPTCAGQLYVQPGTVFTGPLTLNKQ